MFFVRIVMPLCLVFGVRSAKIIRNLNDCDKTGLAKSYNITCKGPTASNKDLFTDEKHCKELRGPNVVDSSTGRVAFTIILPPKKRNYEITLMTTDGKSVKSRHVIHSKLHPDPSNEPDCPEDSHKEIEVEFKFIYSGSYYIEVEPFSFPCVSESFNISTSYKKEMISNVTVFPEHYDSRSQLLTTTIHLANLFLFGSYPNTVLVKLNSEIGDVSDDCSGRGEKEMCCSTGEDTGDCCVLQYIVDKKCGCRWENSTLECTFENIKPGNYCLNVELIDPRCEKNTVWTNESNHCFWYHAFEVEPFGDALATTVKTFDFTLLIVLSIFSVALVTAMSLVFYFKGSPKKIYHKYVYLNPPVVFRPSPTIVAPKIFLLYPRDCCEFMNVMAEFRTVLQDILHAQVYDLWDNRHWERIAESGATWATNFITDPNFKIIIVASACATQLERRLITNENIEYVEPHCHDHLYAYALRIVLDINPLSRDRYSRFFVVRFDAGEEAERKFQSVNPHTVYTLPHHLGNLIMDIHNMDASEIVVNTEKLPKIHDLGPAIRKFDRYLHLNPNYSDILFHQPES